MFLDSRFGHILFTTHLTYVCLNGLFQIKSCRKYCLVRQSIFLDKIKSVCFNGWWLFILITTFHSSGYRTLTDLNVF